MTRSPLRLPLLLALALVGTAACHHEEPSKRAAEAPTGPPVAVRTEAVVASGSGPTATTPAAVFARKSATLSSRIVASVVELPYREGEAFPAGAVVVRLDDAGLRANLTAAESSAATAHADLDRLETLVARGAATPRELDGARSHAAQADAGLAAARNDLTYATLQAPFAGRVASRPVEVGDVVTPGRPLLVVEGNSGYELRASIAEATAVAIGTKLAARIDGFAAPIEASVRSLSPAADPITHRFELRADLPATAGLRSGLFARLELPSLGESRLEIPATAVFARGGLTGVFVADGGVARLRWIAPGHQEDGRIEVRAGLDAGEQVILDPTAVRDGAAVVEVAP